MNHGDYMVLEEVCMTDRVKSWYIKREGTRVMSTLVTETPEGISIVGDFAPLDGVHSRGGPYSAKWFAGDLSSDYLCEKFLRKKYCLDDNMPQLLRDIQDGTFFDYYGGLAGNAESFVQELKSIEEDFGWESRLLEVLGDFVGKDDYVLLSEYFLSYDKRDQMSLVSIQRVFSKLYHEKYG